LTRRDAIGIALAPLAMAEAKGTHQASGVKVGEITPTMARLWARRTKLSSRRMDGIQPSRGVRPQTLPLPADIDSLHGSCPGDLGQIRVLVKTAQGRNVYDSNWTDVSASTDFAHQFTLRDLKPATAYIYTTETRAAGSRRTDGTLTGKFRTAPAQDATAPVNLAMLSCQKYSQRDDEHGFFLYDAIRQWNPHFYLSVGDNVYYDSDDPKVNHVSVARFHWHRMFSLDRVVRCLREVPGYWLKDDHDCYTNDCWPEQIDQVMKPFRWEEGLKIFPEQVPMGPKPYRTFQWGRGLQIWCMEGRDYRTPNAAPDGPSKTIWGPQQKQWLKQSLTSSNAHWKLIVSPTPVVGPDRTNKRDNHSNAVFTEEGREIRRWLAENTKNDTFVLCGDRHWQYHSVHPETKVQEFGCGAASDSHATGTPGEDTRIHRFHRSKGGFLAIQVMPESSNSRLVVEHRDVHGNRVYGQTYEKKV